MKAAKFFLFLIFPAALIAQEHKQIKEREISVGAFFSPDYSSGYIPSGVVIEHGDNVRFLDKGIFAYTFGGVIKV
jgi:hypothetical protein